MYVCNSNNNIMYSKLLLEKQTNETGLSCRISSTFILSTSVSVRHPCSTST